MPDLDPPPAPEPSALEPVARRSRIPLALGITTALGTLVRLWFVLTVHKPMDFDYSDMHGYISRARDLANPHHVSSAFDWYYPTGTSTALAGFLKLFGPVHGWTAAAIFQALASGLEIPLIYVAARRFFGPRVALGAAILFAAHYLSIGFTGFFLSENDLLLALVAAMAVFVPERPLRVLAAGLLLGLGAWSKSQAFLLAPGWALILLYQRRWASAAAVMVGALAVVIPVSVFVSMHTGQRAFISSNGGQTFALGQCPIREISYSDPVGHSGAMFTLPVQNQRFGRGEGEASWGSARYTEPFIHSKFYMNEGLKCIKRFPLHALRMVFFHIADTFAGPPWSVTAPWPDASTRFHPFAMWSNLFVSYLIAPLAFLGFWWRRREPGIWYLFAFPVASVLATAVLFHGDSRFRFPYDFCFFIAACAAVETWLARKKMPAPTTSGDEPLAGTPAVSQGGETEQPSGPA